MNIAICIILANSKFYRDYNTIKTLSHLATRKLIDMNTNNINANNANNTASTPSTPASWEGWVVWFPCHWWQGIRVRYVRTRGEWSSLRGSFCFYETKASLREALGRSCPNPKPRPCVCGSGRFTPGVTGGCDEGSIFCG